MPVLHSPTQSQLSDQCTKMSRTDISGYCDKLNGIFSAHRIHMSAKMRFFLHHCNTSAHIFQCNGPVCARCPAADYDDISQQYVLCCVRASVELRRVRF